MRVHYALQPASRLRVFALPFLLVSVLVVILSSTSCRKHCIDAKWSKAATPCVPPDLARLLVCITAKWNLAKLPHLEVMLREALAYESEEVDILLITDDATSLRRTLATLRLPLNMSFYEGKQDPAEREADAKYAMNEYWLAWEHRKAIEAAVSTKNYTTVLYMEDDTRMPWPSLVSWALDTQLLEPFNFTRCFYRTEFDPKNGQLRLLDYRQGIDVRASSQMVKLDMLRDAPASFSAASRQLAGKVCGHLQGRKSTPLPCTLHRHFVAPDNPFQGLWVANRKQLDRFMQQPIWSKQAALAINTADFALRKPDNNWVRASAVGCAGWRVAHLPTELPCMFLLFAGVPGALCQYCHPWGTGGGATAPHRSAVKLHGAVPPQHRHSTRLLGASCTRRPFAQCLLKLG